MQSFDVLGHEKRIQSLKRAYRGAYPVIAKQYADTTLEDLFYDYLDNPPEGINVTEIADAISSNDQQEELALQLLRFFEMATVRLARENNAENERIDTQNKEKQIFIAEQVKDDLDLENDINDLYDAHVQKSIRPKEVKDKEYKNEKEKEAAILNRTIKAKLANKYRLKEKYQKIFNQQLPKNLTETQVKTKILIKLLLDNYYQSYQNNSAINKSKIQRINFGLIEKIARSDDGHLKEIIWDAYSKHLKEHAEDSRYVLGVMNSIYQLRNVGIVDDNFLSPKNLVGVPDSNIWETLRNHAISQINEYDSSFFKKSNDRVEALAKLRARINKINDTEKDLSPEDKTMMLIQSLQQSSMDAMEIDLEKDKEIGKWSVFSYRNVTGSRYQDMLTNILDKAMPYYISQDPGNRKINLDDSDQLELLYRELQILVERAKLRKVKDNEAIIALYKDPFLNEVRPNDPIYKKQDLPLILDRLRVHQRAIQAYGVTNFSKDAFGVSVDNLIGKIRQYMTVQATSELSQQVTPEKQNSEKVILGNEKQKEFVPVFTSPLFELRNRLQFRMHKLSEDNYFRTLRESRADRQNTDTINTKYSNLFSHMQGKTDLEQSAVIEIIRHIEFSLPDAKNIQFLSSNIDKNHKFVAEFKYINSNNISTPIQFTIENFTIENLKNKTHQVKWPAQSNPGFRIENEGERDYQPTIETLFNYCCYKYLKNVAKKITPDVIEELKHICPDLAEFKTKFYTKTGKRKYFNPYQQYNVIYSDFMKKVHKSMPDISALQKKSLSEKNEASTYPVFVPRKFKEMDDFIISFYENDCKILDTTGKLVVDQLQGANPLVRDNITRIYDKFIKSNATNAFTKFFDIMANEVNSIANDDPQPQYQESYYRRGKNGVAREFQPMLTTSLHSFREYDFHNHVKWKEMRIGTQGEFVDDKPGVTPFFAAYAEAQARKYHEKKFTHIYFNNLGLDRTSHEGKREKAMTLELHKFGEKHQNVAVITLPADKGLMSQDMLKAGERETLDVLAEMIKIAREGSSIDPEKPTSGVRDFYIPPYVKEELYKNTDELTEINNLLNMSIRDLDFEGKRTLTGAEAQALYVNFLKFQLTDFIIRKLDPVSINFACKDAIDRGAFSSLYFNLLKSISLGKCMSKDEFIHGLHAAAVMVKGRAMNHHLEMFANALNAYLTAKATNPNVPEWLKEMNKVRLDVILKVEEKKNKPSDEINDFTSITLKHH